MKKFFKIVLRSILAVIALLLLVWLLIQTGPVQNFIIGKVTTKLSKDLNTTVRIGHISLSLFNKVDIDKALILDRQKDTVLYAGVMKLRITDWFFLKSKIDLKYIGLENAIIKQQRNDSVWNFQFIIDKFTSPQPTARTKPIVLNLQKVDLKNVTYIKNDNWVGQRIIIKVGSMLLDAEQTDFEHKYLSIKTIELDKPYYSIENFDGKRPPVLKKISSDSGMYFNKGNLRLNIGSINITDGFFATGFRGEKSVKGAFDGRNLQVSQINGKILNASFLSDTIKASIQIAALERSGFTVNQLKADFKLTPQIMEFNHFRLRTPGSNITNYYAMSFTDFNKDMADYINKVRMTARFQSSRVNTDDIAFFAPSLQSWNQRFVMSGLFKGTVSNFGVNKLFLRNGANTYASGNFAMKGLPDIDKTNIVLANAIVQTNNRELSFLIPSLANMTKPNLAALGNSRFTGNFTGTVRSFHAKGNMSTAIGGLVLDLGMTFPQHNEPTYKGSIETRQFDLGKFLNVPSIGLVGFKGSIDGYSFDLEKIRTRLDGNFSSFTFHGYEYSNLGFNGDVQKSNFSGELKADDPNFNFTSNLQVDLSQSVPHFNVLGDMEIANLRALKFTKDSVTLTGLFDVDFQGKNIDNFLGYAKLINATLKHNSQELNFDSLTVTAAIDSGNKKRLTLESNQFTASVTGNYSILGLPNSFQSFLHKYYPAYIKEPRSEPANQNFVVTINTLDFNNYTRLLDSNFSGFNNALLTGSINTVNAREFNLEVKIPNAAYKKMRLTDALIVGKGDKDSLKLKGDIGAFYLSDSSYFPNSEINIRSANDHSLVNISTRANNTLNNASLNAEVNTLPDGVHINFKPSSFVVNGKEWAIQDNGVLEIRKKFALAQNMRLTQGFQEISLETQQNNGDSSNNLLINLKNVNMGDFVPLVVHKPRIEGVANGTVYLRDFYSDFKAEANLQATDFRLDNDSVGTVVVSANYKTSDNKINYKVKSDNENYKLNADGYYTLHDSTGTPLYNNITLNHSKIGIVNIFLNTLFSDIDGLATGNLIIEGKPSELHMLGQVHVDTAALTVNYTKVRYSIANSDINFRENGIDFGTLTLKDKFGNSGTLRGMFYEEGFKNNQYDFDFTTDKMLLLDTKAKDNPSYYGTVTGKATVSLKGPQENMQLKISGEVTNASQIFIPTSNSKENTQVDYIVFKQHGTEVKPEPVGNITNLNISLDVTANNNLEANVILDELTGDVIRATGNGRLLIRVPAQGDMTMNGRYNIENGEYNFNFQSLVKKPFLLLPDRNSYIEWNGDPYNAHINVAAQYTAQNVNLGDLTSNTGFDFSNNGGTSAAGYRGDVYVIANLTGNLTKPNISFSLDFPQGSSVLNDDNFTRLLAKIESDENEMLKQVTWLIVFGSFSPYGELAGSSPDFVKSTGINTISQKIAEQVDRIVSDLLFKITGDKSLQLDLGTKTYSSSSLLGNGAGSTLDRQSVNLKLNKSLLNGKVIVTFGGDFDFNVSGSTNAQAGNFQWLPNLEAQIILSRDRKLRAIIFNRSTLGVATSTSSTTALIGRRNSQGVSISYTKDFNTFFGQGPDAYFHFFSPKKSDSADTNELRRLKRVRDK